MVLRVSPDPAHPTGGYALFETPADTVTGDEVLISVFDTYSERYLGETDWQATSVDFGPYAVERSGDTVKIKVGPEIVNQIEEYSALRISLNGKKWNVDWPDDVIQLPGAARIGPIYSPGEKSAALGPDNLVGTRTEKPNEPLTDKDHEDSASAAPVVAENPAAGSRKALWLGLAVLIAALVAAAAWYYLTQMEPAPAPQTPPVTEPSPEPAPETPPVPETPSNPCAPDAIAALGDQAFTAIQSQLATCGTAVSPDAALKLIETAADRNDPAALEAFAEFYDADEATNPIESVIGLHFDDTPAIAAEYYARAKEAGSETAPAKLDRLCQRMAGSPDTLAKNAVKEYCTP
ncbi:MAG: hypothetical protein WAU13_09985 [Albidovulum sp.]